MSNEGKLLYAIEELRESPISLTVPRGTARFLLYDMGNVDYGRSGEANPLCRQNAFESAYSRKVSSLFGLLIRGECERPYVLRGLRRCERIENGKSQNRLSAAWLRRLLGVAAR